MTPPPSPEEPASPTPQGTAVAPPPKGRFSGFEALKVRAYQWYAACAILQQGAESMKMLVNGWYAFELTGSTAILGLTLLAQAVPQTFLSFIGGVMSDRYPRHRVWQICNIVALALPLIMAGLIFSLAPKNVLVASLIGQSFLFGIVLAFRAPARQGIMTEVVGRDKIMSAVSINQTLMNLLQFIGPAVAGFLIAWVGIQWTYLAMAGFYVLSILALLPMKYQRRNVSLQKSRSSVLQNFRDGLKYVGRTPDVKVVLVLTLLAGAFAMPYNQLLPAFAKTVLHTTPQTLGLLSSLSGVGALTGSIGITIFRPKVRGGMLVRAVVLVGIGLVAFCISSSYVVSGAIVMLVGIGQAVRQTLQSALVQTYTEDQYLGRVISINVTQMGLSSMSSFLVALGAEVIGVRYALLITAFLLIAVGVSYWTFSKRLRRLA